jgi:hypothetical protein
MRLLVGLLGGVTAERIFKAKDELATYYCDTCPPQRRSSTTGLAFFAAFFRVARSRTRAVSYDRTGCNWPRRLPKRPEWIRGQDQRVSCRSGPGPDPFKDNDVTTTYPNVGRGCTAADGDCVVLDGKIVARDEGHPWSQALQHGRAEGPRDCVLYV